eukprot:3959034-Lingulodinium_polyedra.AAC.1
MRTNTANRVGHPQFQSPVKTRPNTTGQSANTANTTRAKFSKHRAQRAHEFLRSTNTTVRVHQTLRYTYE